MRVQERLWSDSLGRTATRCQQLLLVLAVVALAVLGMTQLSVVVIPIVLALIIACAMFPVLDFLRRHHIPSALATWFSLIMIVGVIGSVAWVIVIRVEGQFDDLAASALQSIDHLQDLAGNLPFTISDQQFNDARASLLDFVSSQQFGTGALAAVSTAASLLTSAGVFVVVLFFFLKDGPQIWAFLCRPFTGSRLRRAQRAGDQALTTLGGYVRGTAAVALVDAIGIGAGLLILQIPLALPLAVIVFVAAFIPLVGATAAGILATLVALVTNGPVAALLVAGVVVVVNQLEANFLQPVVMGRTLKLHPLVILIALTAGAILGGIVGAILSVPIAATAWGIITVWNGPEQPAEFARQKRPENT
ncbi:AI-2E family transporter [Herbiconiux sp. VKM Ac-2851]|uniref:AI-2E family transporter n=1 Tax=Herbiconiux sp. VKM Ac-2851 TaxID=2739025 RepID=UPI002110ED1A|nr:AI-2E family transporter [Herbiconiux sp. VKM Ac-2851]